MMPERQTTPDADWRPIEELRALARLASVCYVSRRAYLRVGDLFFEASRLRAALRLPQLKQPGAAFKISPSEGYPLNIRWKTGGLNFPDWVFPGNRATPRYRCFAAKPPEVLI